MRRNSLFSNMQRFETGSPHCENAVDVLHFTIDNEIRVIKDSGALTVEDVRHDDGIGDTGLIFQAEEKQAFGGTRTLPADDAAGDADVAAIVDIFHPSGWCDSEQVQHFAMKGHGVFADGEVCSTEIGVQALAGVHRLKGVGGGRRGVGTGEERTGWADGQLGIP